jgi:hypothetical protein
VLGMTGHGGGREAETGHVIIMLPQSSLEAGFLELNA